MQYITKLKLAAVHQLCDAEDRSIEYMLQLMQDICDVDMDCCISYMKLDDKEHSKLFQEVMMFTETIIRVQDQIKI
tara:strand:+ start:302 stop:529 length:228 start_codon:yes stop_codon:yes gene_type:complete